MKTLLLTIGFAFSGILTSFSQAQSIPLTIDSIQSSASIGIAGNSSSSSLSGDAVFEIQSFDPPSENARITALNLVVDQGLSFSFAFGDVNMDRSVNFLDTSPFITLLSTGGFQAEADINQNEVVGFLDISPFIVILSGQTF